MPCTTEITLLTVVSGRANRSLRCSNPGPPQVLGSVYGRCDFLPSLTQGLHRSTLLCRHCQIPQILSRHIVSSLQSLSLAGARPQICILASAGFVLTATTYQRLDFLLPAPLGLPSRVMKICGPSPPAAWPRISYVANISHIEVPTAPSCYHSLVADVLRRAFPCSTAADQYSPASISGSQYR